MRPSVADAAASAVRRVPAKRSETRTSHELEAFTRLSSLSARKRLKTCSQRSKCSSIASYAESSAPATTTWTPIASKERGSVVLGRAGLDIGHRALRRGNRAAAEGEAEPPALIVVLRLGGRVLVRGRRRSGRAGMSGSDEQEGSEKADDGERGERSLGARGAIPRSRDARALGHQAASPPKSGGPPNPPKPLSGRGGGGPSGCCPLTIAVIPCLIRASMAPAWLWVSSPSCTSSSRWFLASATSASTSPSASLPLAFAMSA